VIGAYELAVLETDGGICRASPIAAPELFGDDQRCFHHACYEQLGGGAA
jgi:hypothetical protein